MIYQTINWLDSTKELVSITLPNVTAGSNSGPGGAAVKTRLHLFSVSMLPAAGSNIDLQAQYARSTQLWLPGTNKTQIVEVIINNVGSEWVLANNSVQVSVSSPGLETVAPGYIKRLQPGDQARVQVGVVNADGVAAGSSGSATVVITGVGVNSSYTFNATYGVVPYQATYESVYSHETPNWYNDAKYGIFIHWGVYSVPGWGNVEKNETYAEWYWYDMNLGPDTPEETYQYNLATYGPNHVYDDFIQNFSASVFDPKEWVDLFADAGANYFVQVSKHHDGYALFDLPANVSQRTSVAQYPHRNLLQELFDAAAQYQPQLHRATYFSLPEWFNPAYKEYGFGSWPGGNATNPYTNKTLPYTGFVEVNDYVPDVILPEMNALADMGTEIMWCDIGGPNLTAEFASAWFNKAAESGRQVVMDNRCGLPGDFDTPEYARYDAIQVRKWESNLGMDPFSYGYNRATPTASYMNASAIVTSLLDIVSKNGNFLLDIGPTANGTIIPIEAANLREAGVWIKDHGEAIFNTSYWFITPEENGEGKDLRFTQTAEAFYICSLVEPGSSLVNDSPVPWVEGDEVVVVGGNSSGVVVPSSKAANGSLVLDLSESVRGGETYAWVFKIGYGGNLTGSNSTGPGSVPTSAAGKAEDIVKGAVFALLLTLVIGLVL
ncbi:glycoside hydrolase [Mollisia scopiformis]|uniref:alpha-L-fucosidase n=1 Tax=Mollisia scopiformis TaxID=149040 RepID=A0A194XV75_MOLSC|nr:glycoside hydrolase [Mollisia scopiformis]KUJ24113.1 glycoside hydrolase [Mollisia scopiformis]